MKAPVTKGSQNTGSIPLARLALVVSFGLLALPTPARSASFTFDYDFSSPTQPSGTGPWLRAVIEDTGTTGEVKITLSSLLTDPSEFFSGFDDDQSAPVGIAFNLKDSTISLSGGCTPFRGDGCLDNPSGASPQLTQIPNGINGISSDSRFQGFDVGLLLAPPPVGARFNSNDIIIYTLNGVGLTADQFNTTNPGGFCSAAKVGGTSASTVNGTTTAIAANCPGETPSSKVPAPLPLLGAAAAFGFSRKIRRRIDQATKVAPFLSA
jgi:hypothetical protein